MDKKILVHILFSTVFVLLLLSCVTESEKKRGSLRGAMESAKDGSESHNVPIPEQPTKNNQPKETLGPSYGDGKEKEKAVIDENYSIDFWFGAKGGQSIKISNTYGSRSDGDLLILANISPNANAGVYAGYKAIYPKNGSELSESVKDSLIIMKAGIESRWYPFPRFLFLSPFFNAQMGAFAMFWEFRNPIYSGGDRITADGLNGLHIAAGLGVSLIRSSRFVLSCALTPEAYLYGTPTHQGFDNDYFSPLGSIKLSFDVLFK